LEEAKSLSLREREGPAAEGGGRVRGFTVGRRNLRFSLGEGSAVYRRQGSPTSVVLV